MSKLGVSCDRQECVLVCHGLLTSNRLIVSDGSPLAIDRCHGHDVLVDDVTYTTSIVKLISEPVTVVYYEQIKREIKRILMYECRCNERLEGTTGNVHDSDTLGDVGDWNT